MDRNKKIRRKGAVGKHTKAEVDLLFSRQLGQCAICFCSIIGNYHADHINPLARGGTNWISNIQLLCPPCNMAKGAKDPIEFAKKIGRLL